MKQNKKPAQDMSSYAGTSQEFAGTSLTCDYNEHIVHFSYFTWSTLNSVHQDTRRVITWILSVCIYSLLSLDMDTEESTWNDTQKSSVYT